jgi:hypothetical protein
MKKKHKTVIRSFGKCRRNVAENINEGKEADFAKSQSAET